MSELEVIEGGGAPPWLSLGAELREHAARWCELGPMTFSAYESMAPPYERSNWRHA